MTKKTDKYEVGTPVIRFYGLTDIPTFGIIIYKASHYYTVEWYIGEGTVETKNYTETGINLIYGNYLSYIEQIKGKVWKSE